MTVNDLGILRIDHVGTAVRDLDEAIEFYGSVFGMKCLHSETNEEQGVREAMLAIGPDTDSCIQLLAPLNPDTNIGKFLDKKGPGIHHIAYTVVDVEKASATLRERGMRMLYETAKRGTSDSRVNFVHPKDAGGVLVEIVQPGPESAHE